LEKKLKMVMDAPMVAVWLRKSVMKVQWLFFEFLSPMCYQQRWQHKWKGTSLGRGVLVGTLDEVHACPYLVLSSID